MNLVRSVISSAHELKKYWGRKNMHSVLEEFVSVPMCISRPNQATWSERRMITLSMSVLDLKKCVVIYTENAEYIEESARRECARLVD